MDIHENTNLKPPSTFEQQIEILKSRGLIVDNDQYAISILKRINYYRFSAYCLSFKRNDKFFNGVRFEHILAVYDFDKRLRYLLLNLIESIEIAFRTHISYLIAHKYGCLGHLNQNTEYHKKFLGELEKEFNRSKEIFVTHHKEKYGGVMPVWVALEIIPFGVLSKLYSNMKKEDRECISKEYYSIPSIFIESWLACLTDIRNHCAHYSRLYNKNFNANT